MKLPNRFPTIIGLILVAIVVSGIIFFMERALRAPSSASGSQEPKDVRVTNVTDTTFTVSWLTGSPAKGTLLVSARGKNNHIYFDQRDTTGKLGTYTSHSITVRDATPSTQYSFKIPPNGQEYTVVTATSLGSSTNSLEPAYGTIVTAGGIPAEGALVYLTLDGSQELSAITKSSGLWLIPLNQVRVRDLSRFVPIADRVTETIVARYNDLESAATTDTLNDLPVPEMILGKTYDFRRQQANAKTTVGSLAQNVIAPGTVLGESTTKTYAVTLTQPAQNAAIASAVPLVAGTGIPDKYVGISLGLINPISGSAKVDASGLWSFTPPKPLGAGKQNVTVLSTDTSGKPVAITHTFEILKSGTQVLGDATPSAALFPTETPIEETATLAGETPPITGSELPTIILLILGLGLLIGGSIGVAKVDFHS